MIDGLWFSIFYWIAWMLPFYLSQDELSCLVLAKLGGVENIYNCFISLLSN